MSYEAPSDFNKIIELKAEQDKIRDILFFESIHGVSQSNPFGIGGKNPAFGSKLGADSWFPIEATITDVDESGTATGIFDKINIQSITNVIVGPVGTLVLKIIQHISDGKIFSLTPGTGRTVKITPGGNIEVTSTLTLSDKDMVFMQFFKDTNKVKIIAGSSAGNASQWATFVAVENVKMNGKFFETPSGQIYRFRIDGATEYIFSNLAFKLKNLNRIEFLNSADVAKGIIEFLDPSLVYTVTDVLGAHVFKNLTTIPSFVLEGINTSDTLLAHELLFRGRSSTNVQRFYGAIKVRQTDTLDGSEMGEMEFKLIENGVEDVTYMELNALFQQVRMIKPISMGFRDILLVRDMTLDRKIKSRSATEIGIQVGNEALVVGTEGSLIVPVVTGTDIPANDAALDTDFGDVDGAIGLFFDTNTATNNRIFGRLNGVWYHAFLTRTF